MRLVSAEQLLSIAEREVSKDVLFILRSLLKETPTAYEPKDVYRDLVMMLNKGPVTEQELRDVILHEEVTKIPIHIENLLVTGYTTENVTETLIKQISNLKKKHSNVSIGVCEASGNISHVIPNIKAFSFDEVLKKIPNVDVLIVDGVTNTDSLVNFIDRAALAHVPIWAGFDGNKKQLDVLKGLLTTSPKFGIVQMSQSLNDIINDSCEYQKHPT